MKIQTITNCRLPLILIVLMLFGCASRGHELERTLVGPEERGATAPGGKPTHNTVDTYRKIAKQYEANYQFAKALFMWQAVENLEPSDPKARESITRLKRIMEDRGDSHFVQGVAYLEQKSLPSARREFLLALAYNPNKREAADYLRSLSLEEEFVEYVVRSGDTFERIAQRVYGDAGRHFIVSHFSGMTNGEQLPAGTVLRLPAPDQDAKIRNVQQQKPYTAGSEAARTYDRAGADIHYSKGVSYYLAEQFQEAIREWEEALRLDPEHPNAKRDIQKARNVLKKTGLK